MSSDDREVVLQTNDVSKCYHVYKRPQDRLRQFFVRKDRKLYEEFWALRGVSLQMKRGETLGIVGKNGAGKSTLLQLIAGTVKATSGNITVNGRVTALLELGSGFHNDFTGRENIFVAGALLGLGREEVDERMERIESFADIGEFLDRPVKTYSKGMFARLSFAVYANLDPDIFIVDEALAVGDARFRHKCMYRFRQMQEQGVSIIYVSHDAPSMKHICDRVIWLDQGNVRQQGESKEVVDAYLTDLFHGEAIKTKTAQTKQPTQLGDDRTGSGRCAFTSARLTNATGEDVDHMTPPDTYVLEVVIKNHDMAPDETMQAGFWIRNSRGVIVTGTNTELLGVAIPTPAKDGQVTVRFTMQPPPLAAGSYSCTLMTSALDPEGQPVLGERVVNALVFRISSNAKIPGMVGIDCAAEIIA
jgi:lipopolysaccharide transport system ATP-binding protein